MGNVFFKQQTVAQHDEQSNVCPPMELDSETKAENASMDTPSPRHALKGTKRSQAEPSTRGVGFQDPQTHEARGQEDGQSMNGNARGSKRKRVLQDVFLYEGGEVAEELRSEITCIRVGPRVKDIPRKAFQGCINLATVQFDEGVLHAIGDDAFRDCTALQQVTIPPNIVKFGHAAFQGCINLAKVQLNEGLKGIGHDVFRDCTALQQVTIPSSVILMGFSVFEGCTNLAEVQLSDGLKIIYHRTFRDCRALKQVTIPSSVIELGGDAFESCTDLAKVQLNDGLQIIEFSAFKDCKALQQVTIPSSVTKLDDSAFRGCINLTEVHFNEGVLQAIGEQAFRDCTALQKVTIPSSVTELDCGAFQGCINLTEVQLHEGLKTIRACPFAGCNALQRVTIPSSVTELSYGAFLGCSSLTEVQFKQGSLQVIHEDAFQNCTGLRSVTVPSSITELEPLAFGRCTNLSEVILLGGELLLNQGFFDCGLFSGEGVLNQKRLNEMVGSNSGYDFSSAFSDCPLTTLKISVPRSLSQRMARLSRECRLSVEGRICALRFLDLTQDGNILACFPVVIRASYDEHHGAVDIQDTNNQTAESLHHVLRMISFHELKEASILIELAMWKSRFDENQARADCRVPIPDPAKSLIMEYCGFTAVLEPAIEGA